MMEGACFSLGWDATVQVIHPFGKEMIQQAVIDERHKEGKKEFSLK